MTRNGKAEKLLELSGKVQLVLFHFSILYTLCFPSMLPLVVICTIVVVMVTGHRDIAFQ